MLNRKLNIRLRHSLNSHCIPSIIINNTVRSFQRSVMNTRALFSPAVHCGIILRLRRQLGCQKRLVSDHDGRWSGAGNAEKWHDWYYWPDAGMPEWCTDALGSRISINGNLIPTSQMCNQQTGFRAVEVEIGQAPEMVKKPFTP